MARVLALGALTFLCTGCGGGDPQQPTSRSANPVAASALSLEKFRLIEFGPEVSGTDSTSILGVSQSEGDLFLRGHISS